jgi:nucleoid-associated protein YgaU
MLNLVKAATGIVGGLFSKTSKLTITNKYSKKKFECLLNPSGLSYGATVLFNQQQVPGVESPETKFVGKEAENLSFTILIDGTGAVDAFAPNAEKQLQNLKDVMLVYTGSKHEIAPVIITWGTVLAGFVGRLETMNINYKLLTTDGKPLRAEVSLTFREDTPAKVDIKQRNTNSPDLSHLVEVKEGDNLPEMCQKIYGNPKMYLEVARINKLTNFRYLKAGTKILFPPISKEEDVIEEDE